MPRRPPMFSDFYHRPLTEDVEELLARFQRTGSVRYELFSAVWREMRFSDVFLGITRPSDMKMFCRVALATAAKYFLGPYSYQIRVGGLYLLYGFYHTQLAVPQAKIRFALKDWACVQTFLRDSAASNHYDVVYVFHRLLKTKALHFVAIPHFLAFRKYRKHQGEPMCAEFLGRSQRVQELVYSELLDEMSNVQNHYQRATRVLAEDGGFTPVATPEFTNRLNHVAVEFGAWQEKNFQTSGRDEPSGDEKEVSGEESAARARLLSSIKRKSYGSYQEASRSRRHRRADTAEAEDSGSGADRNPEATWAQRRKPRPRSLRSRTWEKLVVTEERTNIQSWHLSAVEQDTAAARRTHQMPPFCG